MVTSWVSFLIKPEVVPGRMGLLVTLFLVLINIFNSVREQAPISSRLNAIDLYLVVCIFLVFSKFDKLELRKQKIYLMSRCLDGVRSYLVSIED